MGLVYAGCFYRGKTRVKELHLAGNRRRIREAAVEGSAAFAGGEPYFFSCLNMAHIWSILRISSGDLPVLSTPMMASIS